MSTSLIAGLLVFAVTWLLVLANLSKAKHPWLVISFLILLTVLTLLGLTVPHLFASRLYRGIFFSILAVSMLFNWVKFDNRLFLGAAIISGVVAIISFKSFPQLSF